MKPAYIKLNLISGQSETLDHAVYFLAEDCRAIHAPTELDRKQRKEINAVVMTPSGGYAVSENPATILLKLKQATSDLPEEETEPEE